MSQDWRAVADSSDGAFVMPNSSRSDECIKGVCFGLDERPRFLPIFPRERLSAGTGKKFSGGSARARIKIDRPHPVKSKLDQLGMLK